MASPFSPSSLPTASFHHPGLITNHGGHVPQADISPASSCLLYLLEQSTAWEQTLDFRFPPSSFPSFPFVRERISIYSGTGG